MNWGQGWVRARARGGVAVGVGDRAVKPCTEETHEPPVSARARGEWTRATDMRRAGVLKSHSVRASAGSAAPEREAMPLRRRVKLREGGKSSSASKRAIVVVTHRSLPGMGGSSSNGTSAAGSAPAPKSSPRAIMASEKVAVSAWRQSEPPEQTGWTEPADVNGLMWTESCSAALVASKAQRRSIVPRWGSVLSSGVPVQLHDCEARNTLLRSCGGSVRNEDGLQGVSSSPHTVPLCLGVRGPASRNVASRVARETQNNLISYLSLIR